ncbi:MAG: chemotaxis protein, partial [Alcaligenaceae bacterium]|nr:chemotaxis protein [Alcaligenaceae bacterium]
YMEDIIVAARQQLIVNGSIIAIALLLTTYLFLAFYRLMNRCLSDLQNNIRAIRDGDLATEITYYGSDEIASALQDLAEMQSSLRNIVSSVRSSSADIAHSVHEVGAAANDLASRTEQTASNLTESASAMEEIQATAAHTAGNTEEGSRLARDNAEAATHSMQVMQEMVETMQGISQTSDKINDIIATIDSIAFQTNILALNAAVEAARSGEAGRGFAVVAGEVRALAQRSSQASGEISGLIAESVKQVETGRAIVLKSETAIKDVLASSDRVNQLLKEISTGAQEQTVGISEISQALAELDGMTQQNAAMVEETAATAASMNDLAARLSHEVARFRLPNNGY